MNAKSVGRKLLGNPLMVATQTSLPLSRSQAAANHRPPVRLAAGREGNAIQKPDVLKNSLLVQSEVDVSSHMRSPLGSCRERVLDIVCEIFMVSNR